MTVYAIIEVCNEVKLDYQSGEYIPRRSMITHNVQYKVGIVTISSQIYISLVQHALFFFKNLNSIFIWIAHYRGMMQVRGTL